MLGLRIYFQPAKPSSQPFFFLYSSKRNGSVSCQLVTLEYAHRKLTVCCSKPASRKGPREALRVAGSQLDEDICARCVRSLARDKQVLISREGEVILLPPCL